MVTQLPVFFFATKSVKQLLVLRCHNELLIFGDLILQYLVDVVLGSLQFLLKLRCSGCALHGPRHGFQSGGRGRGGLKN